MQSSPPAGAATSPHLPHLLFAATTTTTVGVAGGCTGAETMMGARQEGHVAQVRSQASTHPTWKWWPHLGSTRRPSPSVKSARQIAHSEDEQAAGVGEAVAAKETVGSASMAFFLRPLGGGGEVLEDEAERRRRHAHRETRARPRTQTSAHRSDARMTTMSEFTAITGAVCSCC